MTGLLRIYVPTIKRVDHQFTLRSLPKEWRERTILVTRNDEWRQHDENWPDLYSITTPSTKGISETRAWIFKDAAKRGFEKILVMDDDLILSVRAKPKVSTKLTLPTERQACKVFETIEKKLDTHRHGGISERYFNNAKTEAFHYNCKVLHALAYHVPTAVKHVDIGGLRWHEDVTPTVQLLLAGYENFLYNHAAVNEGRGWNAEGGCSSYRDEHARMVEQKRDALKLQKRYPGIVTAYQKESAAGPMWVCKINWKKAINQGRAQ
jgi:hypothetical protein